MLLNISAESRRSFLKVKQYLSLRREKPINQTNKQKPVSQHESSALLGLVKILSWRTMCCITVLRITEQFLFCWLEEIQTPYQSPKTLPHVLCPPYRKQSLPSLWYCPWVYCVLLLDAPKSVWICSCCLFFIFWTISFLVIISSLLKTAYDYNNPNPRVFSEISF